MSKIPPNRPPSRPQTPPARPGPPPGSVITGGMSVVITVGEVSITIEGPVAKVIATLNWLFGTSSSSATIASFKLMFGPELPK